MTYIYIATYMNQRKRLSWKSMLDSLINICEDNPYLVKIRQKLFKHDIMTYMGFSLYLRNIRIYHNQNYIPKISYRKMKRTLYCIQ
jgi:hypothetical protein